ncbi:MAG: LysM peptidoglycan-binding domain-containing M23 family metallopeptidase [Magnetospirillum sp.]|nr:LysM peptidoglycan-binding domain-containing M23 family metallopeptidase [Magnetospirillum sp.]
MRRPLPHLVILLLLAACEPSWRGATPVSRNQPGQVPRPATVTVYSGDTVYSVARRYNLTVRELIEVNDLRAPYQLIPGTVLRLPGGGSEHVVQRGDTLIAIARRYRVDFNSLAATNNKRTPYLLQVGERLRIPGGGGTRVASTTTEGQGGAIIVTSPNAGRGGSAPPPPAAVTGRPQVAQEPAAPPTAGQTAFAPTETVPPAVPPRAAGSFLWPLKGDLLAEYGPLLGKGQHNDGINIAAAKGTPVKAAENGVVAYVGNELKGFGNLLLVKHADGWMTAYAHADQLMVRRGDQVKRGQTIATVGATGNVTVPQLHFEIRNGTHAVNPLDYLRDAIAMESRFHGNDRLI